MASQGRSARPRGGLKGRFSGRRERQATSCGPARRADGRADARGLRLLAGCQAPGDPAHRIRSRHVVLGSSLAGWDVQYVDLRQSARIQDHAWLQPVRPLPPAPRAFEPYGRMPGRGVGWRAKRGRCDPLSRSGTRDAEQHPRRRLGARRRSDLVERSAEGDPERSVRRNRREHVAEEARVRGRPLATFIARG